MQSLVHAIFSVKKAIPVVYSSVHICIAGLKIIGSVCPSLKLVKKGNIKTNGDMFSNPAMRKFQFLARIPIY